MTRVPLYMHKVAGWEVTGTGLTANQPELNHLDGHRIQLQVRIPTKPATHSDVKAATHSEAKAATLPELAASRAHGGSKWPS